MNVFRKIVESGTGFLAVLAIPVFSAVPANAASQTAPSAAPANPAPPAGPGDAPRMGRLPPDAVAANAPHTIAPYFVPATSRPKAPDAEGFLQRWLLLEPINKPNRSNNVFTDTYVRKTLNTEYFPDQFTAIPHDGGKVTVAGQELAWHALDSTSFNVKLFRFAYGLNKPTYGVLFWAVTVVNSPREMKNVRLAVGRSEEHTSELQSP